MQDRPVARGLPIVADSTPRQPDRAEAQTLVQAQRLLDAGRHQDAAAALAPFAAAPTSTVRAHGAALFAGIALMRHEPARALAALAAIRAAAEGPAAVSVDAGYCAMLEAAAHRSLGDYAAALRCAQQAVAAGATAGRLLCLADAQKHSGDVHAAVATLRDLVEREPAHVVALGQLAGNLNLIGARAEAAHLHAAIAGDRSADGARGRAYFCATADDVLATITALRDALAVEREATAAYIADEVELLRFAALPSWRAFLDEMRGLPDGARA